MNTTWMIVYLLSGFLCVYSQQPSLRNVAINRPSYQSSTLSDTEGAHTANLANDGLKQSSVCARTSTPTDSDKVWWAVDLGEPTVVLSINITTNSGDSGSENLVAGITNVHPLVKLSNYTSCTQQQDNITVSFTCPDSQLPYRYVIVQTTDDNTAIELCEVEVFTEENRAPVRGNVALKKPAFQSSSLSDAYGPHTADLAVDGSRQSSFFVQHHGCIQTRLQPYPWWSVDLLVPTSISHVIITNAVLSYEVTDVATDATFLIGLTNEHPLVVAPQSSNYTECKRLNANQLNDGSTVSVTCSEDVQSAFRYVVVQSPVDNGILSFCEIEVYAKGNPLPETTTEPGCLSDGSENSCAATSVEEIKASGPFFAATIALSVIAVLLLLAVLFIIVIIVLNYKQRDNDKRQAEEARQNARFANRSVDLPSNPALEVPPPINIHDDDSSSGSSDENENNNGNKNGGMKMARLDNGYQQKPNNDYFSLTEFNDKEDFTPNYTMNALSINSLL